MVVPRVPSGPGWRISSQRRLKADNEEHRAVVNIPNEDLA